MGYFSLYPYQLQQCFQHFSSSLLFFIIPKYLLQNYWIYKAFKICGFIKLFRIIFNLCVQQKNDTGDCIKNTKINILNTRKKGSMKLGQSYAWRFMSEAWLTSLSIHRSRGHDYNNQALTLFKEKTFGLNCIFGSKVIKIKL